MKLQASGWDLPISLCSERVTTGFSGTNDTKNLLPLTIRQRDLPSLTSTNAEVLTFLLQERNRKYVHASRSGRRMTELDLLGTLKNMNIRMLIDAGAFVLDMDNLQLAREWLRIDAQAYVLLFTKRT